MKLDTRYLLLIGLLILGLPAGALADIPFQYQQLDFPAAQDTLAFGINNAGEIAGYYRNPFPNDGDLGFTYDYGLWTTYQVPGAFHTDVTGINDAGTLAGSYSNYQDFTEAHGILFSPGGSFQDLAPSGAVENQNYGINNAGDVVGSTLSGSHADGYIYDAASSSFNTITCSGASAFPYGINNSGDIVGFCQGSSGYTAFRTSLVTVAACPTCLTFLTPPGADSSFAYGINDAGRIVGVAKDIHGHSQGFLYDGTSYQFLNFPGATNTYAAGINDLDQVVGWFDTPDGRTHAFVAETPEPSGFALLLGAVMVLSGRLWKNAKRLA